ncbi:hypothetical protein BDV96DRAFT_645419 [Lophiotrema nucula]|uniref:Uncharacterized protein n=1 Tax=Lophiotrema nucula TaxID=690887 RepID=A0A6A5ZCB2_9PLEO|nr:hypothetical protein BDV96DRAFT_645419 [Lophiotrema nucula]
MQQLPQTSSLTVDTPEAKLKRLLEWFTDPTNAGWVNPDVHFTFDESHGYHARAGKDFNPPFDVAKCPLALTISYLNIADHPGVPQVESILKSLIGRVPNHVLNYLVLIEQRLLGDGSRWAPYIKCLPSEGMLTTPLWYSEDDLACIMSTNLPKAASERLAKLTGEWEQAQEVMTHLKWAEPREKFSMTQFKWASTIFSSRAFVSTHLIQSLPTFPILFPVVDILNHSTTSKVLWNFIPSEDFSLRVQECVEAGEQIYNNYAPKQNDELLMGYGFCIQNNPVEQLNFRMPKLDISWDIDEEWYHSELIPFNMGANSRVMKTDLLNNLHFVRTKGNLFGRYANLIPFFKGFPPCVIWHTYFAALYSLGAEPDDFSDSLPNPGGRVVITILRILHHAIVERLLRLRYEPSSTAFPQGTKQYFAETYRQGQAKVVFTIENELRVAMRSILYNDPHFNDVRDTLVGQPCLITPEVAIQLFQVEFPHCAKELNEGLACLHNTDGFENSGKPNTPTQEDLLKRQSGSLKHHHLLWTFLLTVFFAATLDEADSLIYQWLQDLLNVSGIDDEEVPGPDTEEAKDPESKLYPVHCVSRALDRARYQVMTGRPPRSKPTKDLFAWIDNLDSIATLRTHPRNLLARCYGEYTNLRIKVIAWAAWITEAQGIDMVTDEEKGTIRKHLYFQPPKLAPGADGWMYKDYAANIESRVPGREDFDRFRNWKNYDKSASA